MEKKTSAHRHKDWRKLLCTKPVDDLLLDAGKRLYVAEQLQTNGKLVITEALARSAQAAPGLTEVDWLALIAVYNRDYLVNPHQPHTEVRIELTSEHRQHMQEIGDAMAAISTEWPDFRLIRRNQYHARGEGVFHMPVNKAVYGFQPVVIFSLLIVEKPNRK